MVHKLLKNYQPPILQTQNFFQSPFRSSHQKKVHLYREFLDDVSNKNIYHTIVYNWHTDQDIRTIFDPEQEVRKLSFSLQLSDKNEYVGGDLEFTDVDKKMFSVPRDRGCVIVFDSRTIHRVTTIKSGVRKSLVGWVVGSRWK